MRSDREWYEAAMRQLALSEGDRRKLNQDLFDLRAAYAHERETNLAEEAYLRSEINELREQRDRARRALANVLSNIS